MCLVTGKTVKIFEKGVLAPVSFLGNDNEAVSVLVQSNAVLSVLSYLYVVDPFIQMYFIHRNSLTTVGR